MAEANSASYALDEYDLNSEDEDSVAGFKEVQERNHAAQMDLIWFITEGGEELIDELTQEAAD